MRLFLKASAYRALRTVCQAAIAVIGSAAILSEVDWLMVVSASILAGILSLLTSIATGLPEVEYEKHLYMSVDEPDDSEVDDNGQE